MFQPIGNISVSIRSINLTAKYVKCARRTTARLSVSGARRLVPDRQHV